MLATSAITVGFFPTPSLALIFFFFFFVDVADAQVVAG